MDMFRYNTSGSTYNHPYQKMSQSTAGQLQGTKETVNDVGNSSAAASTSAQLGASSLQGMNKK